jgi:uncharacterized protein (TIGR02270 family)
MDDLEQEFCEEHAAEAAFLWSRRDLAALDARYAARDLAALDERVEAHVDGLRLGGALGIEVSLAALESDPEAGAAFTAMLLAVERGDLPAIARVLDLAAEDAAASRGMVSALGWAPAAAVQAILPGLLSRRAPPSLHYVGIGACAAHRIDPGAALVDALHAPDARPRARAFAAAGELGRVDLAPAVRLGMQDDNDACRFAACHSAALFGDAAAPDALWGLAVSGGPFAEAACATALRRLPPRTALSWWTSLSATGGDARVLLAGAEALGDPAAVPWVLDRMADPVCARRAGFALTMITGVDLDTAQLAGKAPPGFAPGPNDDPEDEDVAADPDSGLPWPDEPAVRRWWAREGGRLSRGTRHLLGKPIEPVWLEEVLNTGCQPARSAAAVELLLLGKRKVLPEVRARVTALGA